MPGENIQDWSYNGGEQPCGANCTDAEIESTHMSALRENALRGFLMALGGILR